MPNCARRPWTSRQVYLTEMLTHMGVAREPETFGGGFGAEAFQSLLNEAYAERIVERGGTGIAETVYRQLRDGDRAVNRAVGRPRGCARPRGNGHGRGGRSRALGASPAAVGGS